VLAQGAQQAIKDFGRRDSAANEKRKMTSALQNAGASGWGAVRWGSGVRRAAESVPYRVGGTARLPIVGAATEGPVAVRGQGAPG